MEVFDLGAEAVFDPVRHVEKILGRVGGGDVTVPVRPGGAVVHPPGELHEYVNGPARSVLFRVRYEADMRTFVRSWAGNPEWQARAEDRAYFHPG